MSTWHARGDIVLNSTSTATATLTVEGAQPTCGPSPLLEDARRDLAAALAADPDVSRLHKIARQLREAQHVQELAGARVSELEARRRVAVLEAADGLAGRLASLDAELEEARGEAAAAEKAVKTLGPVHAAARAEAEKVATAAARAAHRTLYDAVEKEKRRVINDVATMAAPLLDELATLSQTAPALRTFERDARKLFDGQAGSTP